MDDRILEGFVTSFGDARGYSDLDTGELFELFVASTILRKNHQVDIVDDFLVGGGGDGGLDVIAILVNGRPALTTDDVDFFVEKMGRLDVEFVFIQAKSGANFKASEIGTFVYGVEQFFSSVRTLPFRQAVMQYIELMNYIFSRSIHMQENPKCYLYYATSGSWAQPAEPASRLSNGAETLRRLNVFSEVFCVPIDAAFLRVTYRDLERGVTREIELQRSTAFPKIAGVDQAYLGLLRGDEFIKLVARDEYTLNRDIFYDNVRDFQGHNPVNREIMDTVNNKEANASFPLLNNGITIVARSIRRTGDSFNISDFQIVNGCQTTHILFQNRSKVDSNMYIPVKLVATEEDQIVTEVIKATNRQTAVLPEALESLTPFHRDLEDYYTTQEAKREAQVRIYYERRSKQYSMSNIKPKNIVTLTAQTKSFVAMFLNEPHSHPRYYGELLKAYEGRLFANDHNPAAYHASGVCLLRVEAYLNARKTKRGFRQYKHHMLMVLRILISGQKRPSLAGREIGIYSNKIVETLRDESNSEEFCQEAAARIRAVLSGFPAGKVSPSRLRAFTHELERSFSESEGDPEGQLEVSQAEATVVEKGRIKWFDPAKGYGFIVRETGSDIFFHQNGVNKDVPWHMLVGGTDVSYLREKDRRARGRERFFAKDVVVREPNS